MQMQEIKMVYEQADLIYSLSEIDQALNNIAQQIEQDYVDRNPVLLCVMNGSVMTTGHLLPKLNFPLELDYIHASRYGDETVGGELNWHAKPSIDLAGRDVILVEDIFDLGITLQALREFCEQAGANSVRCAVLTDKQHSNKTGLQPEYIGLSLPDRYVFGFGMDYKGYWRNAPGIYAVAGS
jgi:hypoxanthine phosphoribosyltransferase